MQPTNGRLYARNARANPRRIRAPIRTRCDQTPIPIRSDPDPDPTPIRDPRSAIGTRVEPTVGRLRAARGFSVSERNAADQRSALRARCASLATTPIRVPIRVPIRTRVEPTVGRLRAVRGLSVSERNAADQRSALRARCASRATPDPRPIHARSEPDPRPVHTRCAPDPRPDPNPGRADRWSAARGAWRLGAGVECSRPTVGSTDCSAAPAPRRCRLARPAPNGMPVHRCAGAAGDRPGSSTPARRHRTAGPCRG